MPRVLPNNVHIVLCWVVMRLRNVRPTHYIQGQVTNSRI